MNVWLAAAFFLLLGMIPCGVLIVTAPFADRLVGLELAGVLTILSILLLAQGFGHSSFLDLSLATALLSFPGGLVYCHFLEKGL